MLVADPALLDPAGDFAERAADYADSLRSTRPADPNQPVRVPFGRSAATRTERLAGGVIEVSDAVHAALTQVATGRA